MKISVIIPTFNTEKYLEKCVKSILNQTYSELQIILVNDGSEDNTLEIMQILEKTDERISIINKRHEGVSAARNAGLTLANGELVSFIDSDDWLDTNTYEILVKVITENNADAVYYEWTEEYSDGTSDSKKYNGKIKEVLEGDAVLSTYFKNKHHFRISSGLLKKKLTEEIFFNTELERGEDMLFGFCALCNAQKVVYTDLPLYHRFHRVGSLSNRRYFFRGDWGRALCTDYMVEYILKLNPQYAEEVYACSFMYYMITLNRILYYHAENENMDMYEQITRQLKVLLGKMKTPEKTVQRKVLMAYRVFIWNKTLYSLIVKIYYKYIKKELDSKRQWQ